MFNSSFTQRLKTWLLSQKKFEVNLVIKLPDNRYSFVTKTVTGLTKKEAVQKAKTEVFRELKIVYKGHKSLGKVKTFQEVI